eukprot:snap_masked-scaffold_9-processed-gene-12.26-mRNA-1 protein AED:1.00 eAED:1.00 QI:0/0/0/0/1/1/2/0/64
MQSSAKKKSLAMIHREIKKIKIQSLSKLLAIIRAKQLAKSQEPQNSPQSSVLMLTVIENSGTKT